VKNDRKISSKEKTKVARRFRVSKSTAERIRQYDSIIDRLGKKNKIAPNLVRGIIAAESRGVASARAKSGYKGLMQAGKNKNQYKPETSIQTGIRKYKSFERSMTRELKKYGLDFKDVSEKGKIGMCMVAYNAGPGTVQKALKYASGVGEVKKWLNPEHFLRALIHYKAYSVKTALSQGLKRKSGKILAQELSQLPGINMDMAAIKKKYFVKNKWKTGELKKAITNHVAKERINLTGKNLTLSQVRAQASKWLLYSVNFKHKNLKKSYVDNVLNYKRYFDNILKAVKKREPKVKKPLKEKVLKTGSERRKAIVNMQEGVIDIDSNFDASGDAPFYERPDLSWVPAHSPIIDSAAKDYGVDPDLVKAIMWVETTHGYYDIVKAASDSEKSVLPMNVHSEYWKGLGKTREQLKDMRTNVRLGVCILSEIVNRLKYSSADKIATLYNNLSADKVSDYGARVSKVYQEKPWKKPVPSEKEGIIWRIGEQLVPASKLINDMMSSRARIGRTLLSQPEKKMSLRELLELTLKDKPDVFNRLENQIQKAQKFNDSQGFSVDFVRWLESFFGLPYSKQSESGKFSKDLTRALELWQHSCGLKIDGKMAWKGDTFKSLGGLRFETLEGKYAGKDGRMILPADASVSDKYDFFKQLVKSRFGVFKEGPGVVNIVGIRGMSEGKQVSNVLRGRGLVDTTHNDTIFLVGQDAKGKKFVKAYPASVDPGSQRRDQPTAHLRDGTYLYKISLHPGRHHLKLIKNLSDYVAKLKKSSDQQEKSLGESVKIHSDLRYTALRGISKQTVLRDFNKDGKLEPHEEHLGHFGINIHISDITKRKPWSIGCNVISGKTEPDTLKNYVDFTHTIRQSKNRNEIPYTLIDFSKVDSLKTWLKFDAGDIIFKGTEKLVEVKEKLQKYIIQAADRLNKWLEKPSKKKRELPKIREATGQLGQEIKDRKTPWEGKRPLPQIRDSEFQAKKKEQETKGKIEDRDSIKFRKVLKIQGRKDRLKQKERTKDKIKDLNAKKDDLRIAKYAFEQHIQKEKEQLISNMDKLEVIGKQRKLDINHRSHPKNEMNLLYKHAEKVGLSKKDANEILSYGYYPKDVVRFINKNESKGFNKGQVGDALKAELKLMKHLKDNYCTGSNDLVREALRGAKYSVLDAITMKKFDQMVKTEDRIDMKFTKTVELLSKAKEFSWDLKKSMFKKDLGKTQDSKTQLKEKSKEGKRELPKIRELKVKSKQREKQTKEKLQRPRFP